jgi:hypothetical protein
MPSISNPQLQATTGYEPRLSLADIVQQEVPNLYAAKQAELQQEQIAQQNRGLDIQQKSIAAQQALQQQELQAQLSGQQQQTLGSAITGAGTAGQLALQVPAVKSLLGLSKAGETATTAGATALGGPSSAPTAAYTTGTAAEAVDAPPATGYLYGTGISGAPAASGGAGSTLTTGVLGNAGVVGSIAGGVGGGLAGGTLGKASQKFAPHALEVAQTFPFGFFTSDKTTRRLSGAHLGLVAGAGLGFATGGPVGAIIGGIFGGLKGGGVCIIHEAAYGPRSIEVKIAQAYRDTFLDLPMQRAYHKLYEPVAAHMQQDAAYRMHLRRTLVDRLIRYGAAHVGIPYAPVQPGDRETAEAFLAQLRAEGQRMTAPYHRRNGEVI